MGNSSGEKLRAFLISPLASTKSDNNGSNIPNEGVAEGEYSTSFWEMSFFVLELLVECLQLSENSSKGGFRFT